MNVRLLLLVMFALLLGGAAVVWPAGIIQPAPMTVGEFKALLDRRQGNLVIVDSRSVDEFQEAHIRGAVNIPLPIQEKTPQALTFAKEAMIVFYCNGFS